MLSRLLPEKTSFKQRASRVRAGFERQSSLQTCRGQRRDNHQKTEECQ